jgi:hypothetical protein
MRCARVMVGAAAWIGLVAQERRRPTGRAAPAGAVPEREQNGIQEIT